MIEKGQGAMHLSRSIGNNEGIMLAVNVHSQLFFSLYYSHNILMLVRYTNNRKVGIGWGSES